ncbi:cupin domain-containing protein [Saccharopolyspora mangrovi]|uniref:Cupin domain-containing protein n=1 Tax=Saccharopolyspora mangrovi TaxID=3082379 RepID=A0ABU6AED0_9PSEU|nr:cupin domain-containing protein [Saccharopolyspora sp. S2-29]MEB3369895.1 cupin domain-containing protein [Saccharopolyspora sp. S2-29]
MNEPHPLPGAVGISHLRAYDWPAADDVCGGSPHIHLTCSEAYVVTGGTGAVHTLTVAGYRETPLEPGVIAWFEPGAVHRMVEGSGLRVTVIMENNGLPEAGDAVFTFPPPVLADPDSYAEAAALPAKEGPEAELAARRRRDLAVTGYLELREALLDGDSGPLREFHRAAAKLVAAKIADWVPRWRNGALRAAERTGDQLRALAEGDPRHLDDARVTVTEPARRGGFGMCGRRDEYDIPGHRGRDGERSK